jgi:hypothetical protein
MDLENIRKKKKMDTQKITKTIFQRIQNERLFYDKVNVILNFCYKPNIFLALVTT